MKKIFTQKNTQAVLSVAITVFLSGILVVSAAAPSGGYLPGVTLDPDCVPGTGGTVTPCIVQPVATSLVTPTLVTAGHVLTADGSGGTVWSAPVVSVDVTLGTANGLTLSGQQISLELSGTATTGALSSVDWNTFNTKENTLTFNGPLSRTGNTISVSAASASTDGYVSQADWNTFSLKQNAITITNTGTTGAATLVGNVLNIPNYGADKWSLAGNDGVTAGTNFIGTIDNTALHLKTDGTDAFVIDNTQDIIFSNYSNTRDDSTAVPPINFLYTDASGKMQSAPVSLLGTGGPALQYYAENSATPSTPPFVALAATGSIAIGDGAKALASNMFVFGLNAGIGANNASESNFFGTDAGNGAINSLSSNFFGTRAGKDATDASESNFFGTDAGNGAHTAGQSNFFGSNAGIGAFYATASNFFGLSSGSNAENAENSNFFGASAGANATNAAASNFFGPGTGFGATNANLSQFFGVEAGFGAVDANNSIFIGNSAGLNDTVNNSSGGTSILIGDNTSTGGFSNSIGLGASAVNTASNQLMIGSVASPINMTRFQGATLGTQCTITAGTGIACTSDERLKENIVELSTDILSRVSQIKTVKYNLIGDTRHRNQIGFLAQNLEQYFPELVDTNSDGYKSVYYAQMTPILVQAIKELDLKINTAILATGNTNASGFFNALQTWLGSTVNGITEIFADTLRARKQICIDEVCIDKQQLQALINQAGTSNTVSGSTTPSATPPEVTTPVVTPEEVTPDNTQEVTVSDDTVSETEPATTSDEPGL
jgi:hypothetical protein